jgi:hypothetical protein
MPYADIARGIPGGHRRSSRVNGQHVSAIAYSLILLLSASETPSI